MTKTNKSQIKYCNFTLYNDGVAYFFTDRSEFVKITGYSAFVAKDLIDRNLSHFKSWTLEPKELINE